MSPHSIGSRPRLDTYSHSRLTYRAYIEPTPTRSASARERPLPRSKVSSPQMLNLRERNSGMYSSISRVENANASSSVTLSVWCAMRSTKLNGRSARSGNSPRSRSRWVLSAMYRCPKVETDGTSSMPRSWQ